MRIQRLASMIFTALAALAQKPCGNSPANAPCDIAFDGPAKAEVWAEFRAPDFKTYRLAAFHDGTRLVFRVNPVTAGEWTYRISGNVAALDGKIDKFTAAANTEATPFIRRANAHHWQDVEKQQPHLYMGADFDPATLEARAAQHFTHLAIPIFSPTQDPGFYRKIDEQVASINAKGMVADLILAPTPAALERAFPTWQQREAYLRFITGRYSAFNVSWWLAEEWESSPNGRAVLKELGLALKKLDPYAHPRSTRAAFTSSPLGPDGWMDHTVYGTAAPEALPAVEHIQNTVPQVVALDAGLPPDLFRKRLWNTSMSGAYLFLAGRAPADSPNALAMAAWHEFFSKRTRYWDLQPFFDLDGARALAIAGLKDGDGDELFQAVEYIAYVEHPAQFELRVFKHSYDVWWVNPSTGEAVKEKKDWKGDVWRGTPPDATRDWVLHLSRDGKKEGMLKSYKFESWPIPVQEPARDAKAAPFELVVPPADATLVAGKPVNYTIKLKKQTAGTRRMTYVLSGEIVRDGQGNRFLAAGPEGSFTIPASALTGGPGVINFRVAALNAPGKLYVIDSVFNVAK
ncbi:MAG: DUF4038 domain-containing protein [Candidatus Solibacter usitatus]|nr:DUF4038 domain-containing protein [Candidatus Solibacter usitatus]